MKHVLVQDPSKCYRFLEFLLVFCKCTWDYRIVYGDHEICLCIYHIPGYLRDNGVGITNVFNNRGDDVTSKFIHPQL